MNFSQGMKNQYFISLPNKLYILRMLENKHLLYISYINFWASKMILAHVNN